MRSAWKLVYDTSMIWIIKGMYVQFYYLSYPNHANKQ